MSDLASLVATAGGEGLYLNVHAQPGARRPALRGIHGDAVRIAVREAAEGGRANAAIEAFVAEWLSVPRRDVDIAAGHQSRRKRVFVRGDVRELMRRLSETLTDV